MVSVKAFPVSATPGTRVESHGDGVPETLVLKPFAIHVADGNPEVT